MAEVIKTIVDVEINTGPASAQLKALQQQINSFNLALNKNNSFQTDATQKYTKELKDVVNSSKFFTAETVRMRTAAGALDSTLKRGSATLGQFFTAKFNKNSALFAETMGLASERARVMQTQFVATSGAAKGMQDAIAIRPLAAFNSQMSISAQRAQILTNMFKQGTTQLINFGKNVQWAGRQLMVGFTVPLTIFGGVASKIFRDIEKEAVNFRKVYGDIFTTDVEVEKALDNVKELATEFTKYGVAVKDTLELAAIGAQAGKTGNELLAATTEATRLSILGDLDKQQAMRTSIALQSAFRLSNEELSNSINFLNMVENSSVLSLQDLAEAIPRVAPVIVGLGGDVKDMAVFLAAMREGGVTAAEAANGLKSSLGRLISPTKQAKEMAAEFGISLEKIVELNEGDVMGMVIALSNSMRELTDLQRQQLLSAVFGKFQFARMGALFDNITREGSNAQNVIKLMDMSVEDLGKTADKELGAIEQSAGTQIVAAMERLKLAIAPIGELFTQLAIPVVNFFTSLIEKFNNLPDFQKRFIAMASVIVGLVIPAGTMFIGLLMNLSGTLAKIMQGFGIFVKGMVSQGGVVGAIKAVTQSTKYMSLEEIDAAIAAKQLGSATNIVNTALRNQVTASQGARAAVADLANTYGVLISRMSQAAALSPVTLGAAGSAMKGAASKTIPTTPQKFARGGMVPGTGNTDTVPAMLMPGEFVIRKSAVGDVGRGFLEKLNNGGVVGLNEGGMRDIYEAQANEAMQRNARSQATISNNSSELVRTNRSSMSSGFDFSKISAKELESSFANRLLNAYAKHSPQNLQLLGGNTVLLPGKINDAMKMKRGTGLNQIQRRELANYLRSAGVNSLAPLIEASKSSGIKLSNREIKSIVNNIANKVESNTSQKMFDRDFSKIVNSELAKNPKLVPIVKQLRTSQSSFRVTGSTQEIINTLNKESPGRYSLSKEIAKDGRPRIYDSKLKQSYTYKSNDTRDISSRLQKSLNPKGNPAKSYQQIRASSSVQLAMAAISKRTGAKNLQLSHFNQGGMVPSLLTPGEFVVGKDAASQNRPFLEALNAGKVRRFQNAGSVENLPLGTSGGNQTARIDARRSAAQTRLAGIKSAPVSRLGGYAGAAAFPALIAGPLMQQSSNEVTKKFGDIVTASIPVLFGLQILAPALRSIAMKFPLMLGPVGGVIAGFAVLAGVAAIAAKQVKEVQQSGAKLSSAMTGSSEQISRFASELGTRTIGQERIVAAASATAEGVTPELQSAAQQFVESDAGQQLLKDIQMVQQTGGNTIEALRNQLNRAVLAGVITPEDAKAIAIEIGAALDDEKLAIRASAQIISILGPDGEFLAENVLKIQAQLQTSLDPESIRASAEAAYEESATGWMRFRDRIFGGENGAREVAIRNIEIAQTEQEVANNISATSDAMEQLKFAYQDGKIGVKEFKDETAKLRQEAGQTITKGLNALGVSLEDVQKKAGSKSLFDLRGTEQFLTATEKGAVRMLKKVQKDAKDVFVKAGLKDEVPNIMKIITDDLAKGDAEDAAEIFAQVISGDIAPSVFNSLIQAIEDPDLKAKLRELFNVRVNVTTSGGVPSAIFNPENYTPDEEDPTTGTKQKSRIEQIRESAKATRDYAAAIRQLASDKNKEAIASIGVSMSELKSNAERREAIKLVKQQLSLQKLLDFALQTRKEQEIARLNMSTRVIDAEATGIQRQIDGVKRLNDIDQRRINQTQRLNEMDQRQVEIRNRALDKISKKEEEINTVYDERIKAIEKVTELNDRAAQRQQRQISLASAIASGDFAAAAAAQAQISSTEAGYALEDSRKALEERRQQELKNLTMEINGRLYTREQIQQQIEGINERIYQRNLQIRDVQDRIYERELLLIPLEDKLYQLGLNRQAILDQINLKQLEIEQSEYKKMLRAEQTNKVLGAQRGILKGIISDLGEAIRRSDYLKAERGAFGGSVSVKRIGMAMGGKVNYKGSNESPPALMMGGGKVKKYAFGSIVPGLGNTDRVPALLTPGEFVVRKSVAEQNMGLLQALNGDIFPQFSEGMSAGAISPSMINSVVGGTTLYNNNYSINVNVSGTDSSANDIANVVARKIRTVNDRSIRGSRF